MGVVLPWLFCLLALLHAHTCLFLQRIYPGFHTTHCHPSGSYASGSLLVFIFVCIRVLICFLFVSQDHQRRLTRPPPSHLSPDSLTLFIPLTPASLCHSIIYLSGCGPPSSCPNVLKTPIIFIRSSPAVDSRPTVWEVKHDGASGASPGRSIVSLKDPPAVNAPAPQSSPQIPPPGWWSPVTHKHTKCSNQEKGKQTPDHICGSTFWTGRQ